MGSHILLPPIPIFINTIRTLMFFDPPPKKKLFPKHRAGWDSNPRLTVPFSLPPAGRFLDTADMTAEELVVLVAALVGAAICIGVLIGAFLFLRVRRKMDPLATRIEENGTGWWR